MRRHDKRSHARHSVQGELTGHVLSGLTGTERHIQATIQDVSAGGLGVLAAQAVPVSSPIRCDIRLSDPLGAIPTLIEVRWVEDSPSGQGVRMGLRFLL